MRASALGGEGVERLGDASYMRHMMEQTFSGLESQMLNRPLISSHVMPKCMYKKGRDARGVPKAMGFMRVEEGSSRGWVMVVFRVSVSTTGHEEVVKMVAVM